MGFSMKSKKKWIVAFGAMLFLVTALFAPSLLAASSAKNAAKLLFVIRSHNAKLVYVSGKQYHLLIQQKDIKSILAFSDRPKRLSFRLTPQLFRQVIHLPGPDSFQVDPANAAISFPGSVVPDRAYTLQGVKISGQVVQFNLTLLGDEKCGATCVASGEVYLFIDTLTCSMVEQGITKYFTGSTGESAAAGAGTSIAVAILAAICG